MARSWGFWTRYKLEILQRYLNAFTTATKNLAPKRVYLDLFGGEPENVDRQTLNPIDGSARTALNIDDPPFTHLRFFELQPNAGKLERSLSEEFPDRDWVVYPGDSNDTIHVALSDLRAAYAGWAPTFAFIDPNGPITRGGPWRPSPRTKDRGQRPRSNCGCYFLTRSLPDCSRALVTCARPIMLPSPTCTATDAGTPSGRRGSTTRSIRAKRALNTLT